MCIVCKEIIQIIQQHAFLYIYVPPRIIYQYYEIFRGQLIEMTKITMMFQGNFLKSIYLLIMVSMHTSNGCYDYDIQNGIYKITIINLIVKIYSDTHQTSCTLRQFAKLIIQHIFAISNGYHSNHMVTMHENINHHICIAYITLIINHICYIGFGYNFLVDFFKANFTVKQ